MKLSVLSTGMRISHSNGTQSNDRWRIQRIHGKSIQTRLGDVINLNIRGIHRMEEERLGRRGSFQRAGSKYMMGGFKRERA